MTPQTLYHNQVGALDGLYDLAMSMAHFFPQPENVVVAIYELMINGIEHGNLGVGYDMKEQLVRKGQWRQEIQRRMAMPENKSKKIDISIEETDDARVIMISDCGKGFFWQKYVGALANYRRPHGRGIWLALHSDFDKVEYNPPGNKVTCVCHRHG